MKPTLAQYVTVLRKEFSDYCTQALAEEGMLPGQLYFVLYIGRHPDCSPKELATALKMDAGHTTRTLAKLTQEGFLLQAKSKTDGRAHILSLTAKGQSAFRLSHQLFGQWDEQALQPLSEAETETLMTLLSKIVSLKGDSPRDGKNLVHPD